MDDFSLDRQELTGSLISLEFGPGGRIQQLWASDPTSPDESEEFQFVAPPLMMGEETTEDYFPGTILLGARTHPDDPWIVSRNARAEIIDDEEDNGSVVAFEYEFAFLDEIRATGKFYEIPGTVPQIAWDVEITNKSRRSLEIGELGFPLALNNVLEGLNQTDRAVRELWNDRVYVHKCLGGSASYIFAQRMTSRPPGLAIFPGGDTKWEFFNHVGTTLASRMCAAIQFVSLTSNASSTHALTCTSMSSACAVNARNTAVAMPSQSSCGVAKLFAASRPRTAHALPCTRAMRM